MDHACSGRRSTKRSSSLASPSTLRGPSKPWSVRAYATASRTRAGSGGGSARALAGPSEAGYGHGWASHPLALASSKLSSIHAPASRRAIASTSLPSTRTKTSE